MKNKFVQLLIWTVVLAIIGFMIGYVADVVMNGHDFGSGMASSALGLAGMIVTVLVFWFLKATAKEDDDKGSLKEKKGKKGKDNKPSEDDQYFTGGWLTEDYLRKNLIYTKYSKLKTIPIKDNRNYKGAGIVIKAKLNKPGDMDICLAEPIHTMVIGNTGSGKTQTFIIPSIQILSELESKPSMVIADLKGELYDDNSNKLRDAGYNVVVFDLRAPMQSDRWNPLERSYANYQRAINLKKEFFVHRAGHPSETKLQFDSYKQFTVPWFEFDGAAYCSEEEAFQAIEGKKQALIAEVTGDIKDIMGVIVSESKDPMWSNGARDFAQAILLSMLEDSSYPELGMTKEKFNFFNFYKIANYKDDNPDDNLATLKKYVSNRSPLLNIRELASSVVNAAPTTASSFMATLGPYISLFADPGIGFITSATEIDFSKFADQPTAFFLKVPDEKVAMHKIASICIEQLYKALVDICNKTLKKTLPRPLYFILDEFANMPKIEGMGQYITVSRSRNITWLLVVQDYTQLKTKYGEDLASTIKANCNIHIFIGSGDPATLDEFVKKCGKTTVMIEDKSESKQKGGKDEGAGGKNVQTSVKEQQRDLIFVEELRQIPQGEAIVLMDKRPAYRTILTHSWKSTSVYKIDKAKALFKPTRFLDEQKVLYDLKGYIRMKSGGGNPSGNSGGFNFNF